MFNSIKTFAAIGLLGLCASTPSYAGLSGTSCITIYEYPQQEFECPALGKDKKTVEQLYKEGYRIVAAYATPTKMRRIFIEKQD